jgi:cytochrome c peroxidase
MKQIKFTSVLLFFLASIIFACQKETISTDTIVGETSIAQSSILPANLKSPVDNPSTTQKVSLGKLLFYDPILSGKKDVACATCHNANAAYTDGLDLSIGTNAVGFGRNRHFLTPNDIPFAKRNAQTILNTAYNGFDVNGNYDPATAPMFWDSRTKSLENQVFGPIQTFEEMRGHAYSEPLALDSVVARLKNIPEYRQLFLTVFGNNQAISNQNIGKAIAAFERTLLANNAPYDRFQKGDKTAMTPQQIQGMQAFQTVGCAACHSGDMFSDYQLHVLSVPDNQKSTSSDNGNGNYAFRTASLRNISLTAPYMHSGVFQDLNQVLGFYGRIAGGNSQNPNVNVRQIDPRIRQVRIGGNQQNIIAFINALTDNNFDKTVPIRVPSNLSVGGNIR